MKKTIIASFAFLFLSIITVAQKIKPTTEDEFNFGSIGYKIQLQMKLPMKKGYSIIDLGGYEEPDRSALLKGLLRDGETLPCAVILVYSKINTPPEYFCMPTPDAPEALWTRFHQSLNVITENPQQQLQFMMLGMSKTIMKLAVK
ncbi:MAG: hypothetical protein ABI855_12015 [Bacteroidota bacterium]